MQRTKPNVEKSSSTSEENDGCICLRNPLLALFFFLTGYIGMVTVAILLSANNVHTKRRGTSGEPISATLPPEFYRRYALQEKVNSQSAAEIPVGSQQYLYPMLVDMLDLVERVKNKKALPFERLHEPVQWLSANSNLCGSSNSSNIWIELLILIRSEPEHNASREAIRDSWARRECFFGQSNQTQVLFLVERPRDLVHAEVVPTKRRGRAMSSRMHSKPLKTPTSPKKVKLIKSADQQLKELWAENKLRNDLVVTQSLGAEAFRKTGLLVAALDWMKAYCSHARHVLILDDSYFVQPGRLAQLIGTLSESLRERLAVGQVVSNEYPARNPHNNNYVPRSSYPSEVYPPYLANAAVLLSGEMAVDLAIACHYVKLFHLDEIFLALVMDKLLIHPQHVWNFVSKPQRMNLDPVLKENSRFAQIFVSHGYQNPSLVRHAWTHFRANRGHC